MTYQELAQRIVNLQNDGIEIFNIGKSTLGKNILATHLGFYSGPQIIIQGGIHSREYISTLLMVEQVKYLKRTNGITQGGIYFVFLTNPDGAEIVLDGLKNIPCEVTKQYLTLANNGDDFSQFKANVNLVDLNTNFDADWGSGNQNVKCPNPQNFIGFYPNSEREVNNLINFTNKNKPSLTISYHSKGEVIYYGFSGESQSNLLRDRLIGEQLSLLTGYPLLTTENSSGGYKDWCIRYLQIPSYTIEVGREDLSHPIGEEFLEEIFEQNKDVPLTALNLAIQYQNQINVQGNIKLRKNKITNLFGLFKIK